jgi:citrate lyase beta subunit
MSQPVEEIFGRREPIHVVYGGAQLFTAETFSKVRKLALKAIEDYAPTAAEFERCLELDPKLGIFDRVVQKLKTNAVEDYRIDFEDGYGSRPDAEEDKDAARAAQELAKAVKANALPPFFGIRVKSLSPECKTRSLRTLDLFISTLNRELSGKIPSGFLITLPKVTTASEAAFFAGELAKLEKKLGIASGTLRFEAMVETPQLLMSRQGVCELPLLIKASEGRLEAAHFGAYDYTAACGVAASHQTLGHPACDFARQMMKLAFSGTTVRLSDGATNVMPIGPHRSKDGAPLSPAQLEENRATVHRAWRLSFQDVSRSLMQGFYQGWDLHPAQVPVRYAAVYTFFRQSHASATARLKSFLEKAAQASLSGNVFDDAASGQGLLNFFLQGLYCGAFSEKEALSAGLTLEELKEKSFLKIAQSREAAKTRA